MGEYDKVIKENIEAVFLPLLEKFTGIKIVKSSDIKDKIQRTFEREPDFLKKVTDQTGKAFILQLEFQTHDDPEMVYRMAEYKALIQRKHKLPVKQFVVYLGAGVPKMRAELEPEERITGFELQNINKLKPEALTASDVPQEILLAVLSGFPKKDAEGVIAKIIAKLQALSKSQTELEGYLQLLIILSRLRKFEVITKKKVEAMPITYDITTDGLYKQGIEKGIEKGIEQGIGQGIELGQTKKTNKAIIKALEQGVLTLEQIAEMLEVPVETVIQVRDSLGK